MGRPNRVHIEGGIYHVIMRGNAREPIFFDTSDHRRLNQIIAEGLNRYACRLHAYCWMTNHIHAAIQVTDKPLSGLMCWTASKYARYINRKRGRTGHLFERRHKAILVKDDAYLLGLVRYIHLNPVRAGLVRSPEQYSWSSHRAYLGTQSIEWVTTNGVLSCFSTSTAVARQFYRRFMSQNQSWSPYKEVDPANIEDENLTSRDLSMQSRQFSAEENIGTRLGDLVKDYCLIHYIDPAAILGPGRQRAAARARAIICNLALSTGICTLVDLSHYFGRAPEVISRGINRYCPGCGDEQTEIVK